MAVSEKSISDKIEKSSLAEELRKERENNDLAFNTKYSHKEDLENLLKLAEELKEKSDKAKNRIRTGRVLQVISATVLIIWTFYGSFILFKDASDNNKYIVILVGLFTVVLVIELCQFTLINAVRKQYLADRLALSEVLQLLRETSNVIAEQEDWSVLSRAEFRIRLSRFNLEEKSKSAFNFFL